MLADPTMLPNKSDVPQKQRFILSLHRTDARQFLMRLLKTNQMRPLEVLKTAVFRTCHLARFGLLKTMLGSQCATAEDVIQQVCHSWGKLLRKGCATRLTFHLQAQDSVVHKQHVSLRQSLFHSATTQQTEHLQSASNVAQIF